MESFDIDHRFNFHSASTAAIQAGHERIREAHKELANELNAILPDGREKSLAITKLEEAMMWANAALARHPEDARLD